MTPQPRTSLSSLANVVRPDRVIVVGASSSRSYATGNQVIRNLRSSGFRGDIAVVNPAGGIIEGIEVAASFDAVGRADLAVIAVSPRAVSSAVRAAQDAGIPAAIVMSVGMSETERTELAAFAHEKEMRVHGPNCMGIINVNEKVMLWADEGILTDLASGSVALISQSGSGAIFVVRSMTGVGFSHIVSTGNESSTSTADYIEFLAEDANTEVIGVIVESLGDADRFARAVERAQEAGKPVVALKVGRSAAGALATVAHTGAMLADDVVVAAYFERIGVPLVRDYDELATTLELLAHLRGKSLGEGRLAVITISGGQAALAADLADSVGAQLASLTDQTREGLTAVLPGAGINNPLDAGGSEAVDDNWFRNCLDLLATDPTVDVVLAISDSQASLNAVEIKYEDELVEEVRAAAARHSLPFVIASSSSLSIHPSRVSIAGDPVPVVRGIANGLAGVVAARVATSPPPAPGDRPHDLPTLQRLHELRERVRILRGEVDGELQAELLAAYGVATPSSVRACSVEKAVSWAESAGYPVVLKVDSPDIPHRTEVDGVVLGIEDADELRRRWSEMFDRVRAVAPGARISGAEVQRQLVGGIEAIVGAVSHPSIGATVAVGLGGVLVELLSDTASALAPLSPAAARQVLGRTRLRSLLDGYRNIHPVVDDGPLVETLIRISWLMVDFRGVIAEFEANPILIDPSTGAAIAVDVLVVPAAAAGS